MWARLPAAIPRSPGRGKMPLPQLENAAVGNGSLSRRRGAGHGLRFTVPRTPQPATRDPSPAHAREAGAAEAGGGYREAGVGAPFGRGRLIFPVSRNPSPDHPTNVGAASSRDSSVPWSRQDAAPTIGKCAVGNGSLSRRRGAGHGLRFTVPRTPQPATRDPSPAHAREAGAAEAGGGYRETGVGARSARGRLIFPVSRLP